MAASVGIGFQCVQRAAEGGFRALTGRPGAGRPNGPGTYTETLSDARAAEDVGPYHGTTW